MRYYYEIVINKYLYTLLWIFYHWNAQQGRYTQAAYLDLSLKIDIWHRSRATSHLLWVCSRTLIKSSHSIQISTDCVAMIMYDNYDGRYYQLVLNFLLFYSDWTLHTTLVSVLFSCYVQCHHSVWFKIPYACLWT